MFSSDFWKAFALVAVLASLMAGALAVTLEVPGEADAEPGELSLAYDVSTVKTYKQLQIPTMTPVDTWTGTGHTPWKYYLSGLSGHALPAGLTFDTTTGVISGTPTSAADYDYTVSVRYDSNAGEMVSCTVHITVVDDTRVLVYAMTDRATTIGVPADGSGTPEVAAQYSYGGGSYSTMSGPVNGLSFSQGVISGTPASATSDDLYLSVSYRWDGSASNYLYRVHTEDPLHYEGQSSYSLRQYKSWEVQWNLTTVDSSATATKGGSQVTCSRFVGIPSEEGPWAGVTAPFAVSNSDALDRFLVNTGEAGTYAVTLTGYVDSTYPAYPSHVSSPRPQDNTATASVTVTVTEAKVVISQDMFTFYMTSDGSAYIPLTLTLSAGSGSWTHSGNGGLFTLSPAGVVTANRVYDLIWEMDTWSDDRLGYGCGHMVTCTSPTDPTNYDTAIVDVKEVPTLRFKNVSVLSSMAVGGARSVSFSFDKGLSPTVGVAASASSMPSDSAAFSSSSGYASVSGNYLTVSIPEGFEGGTYYVKLKASTSASSTQPAQEAYREFTISVVRYVVTYVSNGETVGTQTAGATAVLAPPEVSKAGHVLMGWTDGTGCYSSGDSIGLSRDVTLEAMWAYDSIILRSIGDVSMVLGTPAEVGYSITSPALSGVAEETFWARAEVAAAADREGLSCAVSGGKVILTASAAGDYEVTLTVAEEGFNSGEWTFSVSVSEPVQEVDHRVFYMDGESEEKVQNVAGAGETAKVVLDPPVLTKAGHVLMGWTDGEAVYVGGEEVDVPADGLTLSAIWLADEIEVAEIGDVTMSDDGTVSVEIPLASPEVPGILEPYMWENVDVSVSVSPEGLSYSVEDGVVTFSGGEPGESYEVTVTVSADGFTAGSQTFTITVPEAVVAHTITYMSDGAQVEAQTVQAPSGAVDVEVSAPHVSKDGHVLVGWTDGRAIFMDGDEVSVPDAGVTLSAIWLAEDIEVAEIEDITMSDDGTVSVAIPLASPEVPGILEPYMWENVDVSVSVTPQGLSYSVDDGVVAFSGGEPGEYEVTVTVSADGFTSDSQTFTVTVAEGPVPDVEHKVTYVSDEEAVDEQTAMGPQGLLSVELDPPVLTKAGHVFMGWTDGRGIYFGGDSVQVPTAGLTLEAIWLSTTIALAEIGEVTVSDDGTVSVAIPLASPEVPGILEPYMWENVDVSVSVSPEGLSYTVEDGTITFSGGEPGESYEVTVTVSADGFTSGTRTFAVTVAPEQVAAVHTLICRTADAQYFRNSVSSAEEFVEMTLPAAPAAAEGLTFLGWKCGSAPALAPGSVVQVPAGATVYEAVWTSVSQAELDHKVVYKDGQDSRKVQNVRAVGSSAAVVLAPPVLTKDGKVLFGWSADPDAEQADARYAAGKTVQVTTSGLTLYAVWGEEAAEAGSEDGSEDGSVDWVAVAAVIIGVILAAVGLLAGYPILCLPAAVLVALGAVDLLGIFDVFRWKL